MTLERPKYSQVFIDFPNLVNERVRYRLFDPEPLIQHIVRFGVGQTHANYFCAYTLPNIVPGLARMEAELVSSKSARVRIKPVTRKADVDGAIVNDIWYQSVLAVKQQVRTVRHIVVSGDADYYHTYQAIRSLFNGELAIELVIFSWRDSCSTLWKHQADRVHYLDDIPGLVPA